jgi:hypothetical protein
MTNLKDSRGSHDISNQACLCNSKNLPYICYSLTAHLTIKEKKNKQNNKITP